MSRLDFPYDPEYSPPAPVVDIIVRGQDQLVGRCQAVVDTSSGVTCIPVAILDSVRAPDADEVIIRALFGHRKAIRRRKVTVGLRGSEVELELNTVPHDSSVALLGLDFLNRCVVVLDGRAQRVTIDC